MPNSTFSISRPAFCTSLAAILQGVALASALAQAPPTSQEKTTAAQEDKKSLATKVQQAPSAAPITKIPAGAQSQEDKAAAVDKVQQTPSAPPITKVPTRRQSVTQNPPKAGVAKNTQTVGIAAILARQNEAREAENRGDLSKAATTYQQAIQLARQENNKEAIAAATLKYAAVNELSAIRDSAGSEPLDEAAKAYREVIAIGTPAQKLLAQNNLGTTLLRQGKPKEALEVLQTMSYLSVPPPQRYIYTYNTARALEQTGEPMPALKLYAEALSTQPGFEPALDAAFRVSWKSGLQGRDAVVKLAQQLIEHGQAERVAPHLRESLKVWASDPQLQQVLAPLVRCYAEISLDPAAFEKTEWPVMAPLSDTASGVAVREIHLAFGGPLRPTFYDPFEPVPIHAWRSEPWKVPYSLLLRRVGDIYRRKGQFNDALARYALAWSLNRADVEAALYAADLLQEETQMVDRDGRLLNQFIEKLFETKANAYLNEDWLNILRFHTVLGTIYVRQEKWGTPGNPRGALFQFEHAIEADKRYRAKNPKFPASSGLYTQLADVYMHINRRGDAAQQYFAAADAYVGEGRGKEARDVLNRLKSIQTELSPADQQRYTNLVRGVQVLPIA